MDSADHSDEVRATPTVIDQDTPCRKCGYNLRGLVHEGRCPECGTPIGLSLHGRLLRYAEPAWVERLARGVNLILWGLLLTIAGSVCASAITAAMGLTRSILVPAVTWLGAMIGVYGAWLLTEPDPSGIGEDEYGRIRRVTRCAVVIGAVAGLVNMIAQGAPGAAAATVALVLAAALGSLVGWVGEFCKFWFMEKLALRIPDQKLAGRARFLRWALCLTGGLIVLTTGVAAVLVLGTAGPPGGGGGGGGPRFVGVTVTATGPSSPPTVAVSAPGGTRAVTPGAAAGTGPWMAVGCVGGLLGLVALVLTLLAVRMQWQLRNALREQAGYARQTWAAASELVPPET